MKLIKGINHDVDNSPAYVLAMSNFLNQRNKSQGFIKNPNDWFGLMTPGSHRQHGHDVFTAMFIGMQNARALGLPASSGMIPAFSHLIADNISNKMASRMGTPGRNLWEALFIYQTRKNKSKSIF